MTGTFDFVPVFLSDVTSVFLPWYGLVMNSVEQILEDEEMKRWRTFRLIRGAIETFIGNPFASWSTCHLQSNIWSVERFQKMKKYIKDGTLMQTWVSDNRTWHHSTGRSGQGYRKVNDRAHTVADCKSDVV